MRKFKRLIHKQFGGVGNFFAMIILVSVTVIFVNTYVLSKRNLSENSPDAHLQTIEQIYYQNGTIQHLYEQPSTKRPFVSDPGCTIDEKCSDGSFPYKVISGEALTKYPMICFNNRLLVDENLEHSKIGRGINLVVIDSKTYDVKLLERFDTYLEETFLLRTLKLKLNDSDIVLLASYDEMTYGLREATLKLLENYGSRLIKNVKYRDSFVMIGQKGLARGSAIENHQSKGKQEYGPRAQISGCAKFPLGQITPILLPTMEVNKQDQIEVGPILENCGLNQACTKDEIPIHVYTGKDTNDTPKICVNGTYFITKGVNDAGRGLNIVVISNNKQVIRTGHFDTWQDDSTNLELFLENLEDHVIIVVVSFDEASLKLSPHCRNLFFDLGSATIQNLKYRDDWVLVGQKGIQGFSPYEEISYAGTGNSHAPPIDKRMCIPPLLKGVPIRPDPLPYRNEKRREFCSRYDGYGDFCNDVNIDKSLVTIPLVNKTLEDNLIYSTPILVIAGTSHNSLRMCLETLLMQPGVNTEYVVVAVDDRFIEAIALIDLFGFRNEKTSNCSTYKEHYEKALSRVWGIYPNKDKVIIIEEEVILSPDFLYTLAMLSETFRKDETIGAIQMWNPNSFEKTNGSVELIYRVDQLYGLSYLIRRSFYEKNMRDNFKNCCSIRLWERWMFSDTFSFLMPDVSRIFRRPLLDKATEVKYIKELFNQKRKTSLNPFPSLSNIHTLRKDKYDSALIASINSATLLQSLGKCVVLDTNIYEFMQKQNASNTFKYIYKQQSSKDMSSLLSILPCFALYSYKPLGLYHGVLRFNSNQYDIYLVGSKSTFYTQMSHTV